MRVLAINCGSSSVKWATFEVDAKDETAIAKGAEEGAGDDGIAKVLEQAGGDRFDVVAHRIVHGGPRHDKPAKIDETLRNELSQLVDYAPLHLPPALDAIDAVTKKYPKVQQIACFDTAFHHGLPEVAKRLPLPTALTAADDGGLRRYGFHGLSCESVLARFPLAREGRTIVAHLGSGSSVTAMRDGKSVDTTMSFTPTAGVVMATRTGDLDPGVAAFLVTHRGFDGPKLNELCEKRSGLLAVSETTGDMKKLLDARTQDPRAALAVQMYIYYVKKAIGALAAVLGGVDRLVFTGGIGEKSEAIRSEITRGLGFLAIGDVQVVAAEEERVMARHAFTLG